jgi:hypothetical protein
MKFEKKFIWIGFILMGYFFVINACNNKINSLAIDPSKKLEVEIVDDIFYDKSDIKVLDLVSRMKVELDFFDIFQIDEVTFLDETVLVGNVEKLIFFDGKYYVFDKISESLKCFSSDGSILWDISNKGEGPEEYLKINDFDVDFEKKEVHLWDSRSLKVLVYDSETGVYLNSNQNQSFGHALVAMDNKYFFYPLAFYNEDQAFKILITNRSNKLIGKSLPFESYDYENSYLPEKSFSKDSNHSFYFTQMFNDTIYHYRNDTIKADFVILKDGIGIPSYDNFSNTSDYYQRIQQNQISASPVGNLIKFGNSMFFSFSKYNQSYSLFTVHYGLLDLLSGNLILFDRLENNPFDWRQQLPVDIKFANNGFAFMVVDPAYFNDIRSNWSNVSSEGYVVKDYFEEKYSQLHDIVENTENDSNPIIIKLKLK